MSVDKGKVPKIETGNTLMFIGQGYERDFEGKSRENTRGCGIL